MGDYVGVVLAAGRGRRMGALAEHYPKPLLPVANEPLICHHLRTFADMGIEDAYVVIGKREEQIQRTLGDRSRHGVHIRYVEQGLCLGSAHALGQLAAHINGPFVLILGDYYYHAPGVLGMLERARGSEVSVIAAKREMSEQALCEACTLETAEDGRVVRIVEKPKVPGSNLKGCGIYIFAPEVFDAVRRTPRTALRDEYELSVTIDVFVGAGYPVFAEEVIEWDMNFTRPEDVLRCNVMWLKHQHKAYLLGDGVRLAPGCRLDHAIVADRVIVEKPTELRNVVMFEGVRVRGGGQIEGALLTPKTIIQCNGMRQSSPADKNGPVLDRQRQKEVTS